MSLVATILDSTTIDHFEENYFLAILNLPILKCGISFHVLF